MSLVMMQLQATRETYSSVFTEVLRNQSVTHASVKASANDWSIEIQITSEMMRDYGSQHHRSSLLSTEFRV